MLMEMAGSRSCGGRAFQEECFLNVLNVFLLSDKNMFLMFFLFSHRFFTTAYRLLTLQWCGPQAQMRISGYT